MCACEQRKDRRADGIITMRASDIGCSGHEGKRRRRRSVCTYHFVGCRDAAVEGGWMRNDTTLLRLRMAETRKGCCSRVWAGVRAQKNSGWWVCDKAQVKSATEERYHHVTLHPSYLRQARGFFLFGEVPVLAPSGI